MEFGKSKSQYLIRGELNKAVPGPVVQLNGEEAKQVNEILKTATNICQTNRTTDTFTARNVPYMLEIWQRVEGVNLESLLQQQHLSLSNDCIIQDEEGQENSQSKKNVGDLSFKSSPTLGGGAAEMSTSTLSSVNENEDAGVYIRVNMRCFP